MMMPKNKKILILSLENDYHALIIQAYLKKFNANADILDTSKFPADCALKYFNNQDRTEIYLNDDALSGYHSVWWRRVGVPKPAPEITNAFEAQFAVRECSEGLWGSLAASKLPIYNQPEFEKAACYKPLQLKAAKDCGLPIPETLVTNSPAAVHDFRERHEHVIYKALSATVLMMTDTRPLRAADLAVIENVRYAPVIFQEYLPLGKEYRVTLVEDEAFAARIKIQNPKAHYDWRLDHDYKIEKVDLPADVIEKLQNVRRALRLNSGSADLRETPDGKIYFLEINPSGQFLFLDVFAKTNIAAAVCQMLLQ